MSERMTLRQLEKNLSFFHQMYDAVRLVDPVRKRVLECREGGTAGTAEICYDYWKNGKICENCISVRAHQDHKSYMKLEQNPEVIMLVTALPVESSEKPVVLELLKNATDSLMVGTGEYNDGQDMRKAVSDINRMVVKDHLTSLYNRRFVDERLPADIVRATVRSRPLSVIFMDLDRMKAINDTYGHAAGDDALKHVADAVRSCIRAEADWAARYGGDEFLICLNGIGGDEARRIAERIRSRIETVGIPDRDEKIRVSVSFGIQAMAGTPLTAEEMIRMADRNMYAAKKGCKEPPR